MRSNLAVLRPVEQSTLWPDSIPAGQLMSEADLRTLMDEGKDALGRATHGAVAEPRPVRAPSRPYRRSFIPCNGLIWRNCNLVTAALLDLDEEACLVTRVDLEYSVPVIHLARPPAEGVVASRHELVRKGPKGERLHIGRADFMGCTLEWEVAA